MLTVIPTYILKSFFVASLGTSAFVWLLVLFWIIGLWDVDIIWKGWIELNFVGGNDGAIVDWRTDIGEVVGGIDGRNEGEVVGGIDGRNEGEVVGGIDGRNEGDDEEIVGTKELTRTGTFKGDEDGIFEVDEGIFDDNMNVGLVECVKVGRSDGRKLWLYDVGFLLCNEYGSNVSSNTGGLIVGDIFGRIVGIWVDVSCSPYFAICWTYLLDNSPLHILNSSIYPRNPVWAEFREWDK